MRSVKKLLLGENGSQSVWRTPPGGSPISGSLTNDPDLSQFFVGRPAFEKNLCWLSNGHKTVSAGAILRRKIVWRSFLRRTIVRRMNLRRKKNSPEKVTACHSHNTNIRMSHDCTVRLPHVPTCLHAESNRIWQNDSKTQNPTAARPSVWLRINEMNQINFFCGPDVTTACLTVSR